MVSYEVICMLKLNFLTNFFLFLNILKIRLTQKINPKVQLFIVANLMGKERKKEKSNLDCFFSGEVNL